MSRILLLVLSILLLPYVANATNYYVSQDAANGYVVGNNTNNGTSKSTPRLTIESMYGVAANGDTIYINPSPTAYLHASNFDAGTSKGLTIICDLYVGSSSCLLRATSGNQVWTVQTPAAGTMSFVDITFDANNARLRCVTITNNVAISTNTFIRPVCINPIDTGIVDNKNNNNLTITNATLVATDMSGTNTIGGLYSGVVHQTGNVIVDGIVANATQSAAIARPVFYLVRDSGSTAITVSIKNITGTLTSTATGVGTGWYGPQISNIDDAVIEYSNLTFVGTRTAVGAQIRSTSGSLTAHRGIIRYNKFVMNGITEAYCGLLGESASTVGNNQANQGRMYLNECIFTAVPGSQTPHGFVAGVVTDPLVYANKVTNAYVCTLASRTTRGVFTGNLCLDIYGLALYGKGATNTIITNNTVTQKNSKAQTACLGLNPHSDATNNSGIRYVNNLCVSDQDSAARSVWVAASQTGTFDNNDYWTTQPLNSDQWSYQSVNDNTLNGWNGRAQVGNDLFANPYFPYPDDYQLGESSVLRRAGMWSTNGCFDFRGRPCFVPPDIGAFQTSSGDLYGTRSTR
jgi:hypothetical protein